MLHFFKKNWFIVGIALVVGMAFALPGLGRWVREYNVLNIGIFFAFLVTGLTLETRSIGAQLRKIGPPLAAMVSSLLIIPLLAWGLSTLVFSREIVIGVCIIATAPVTVAAGTVMTEMGRGNVPLSLFICVLGNALAVFTIPFSLDLLLHFGGAIELPVGRMLLGLAVTVLVPTLLGQVARPLARETIIRYRKAFSTFQQSIVFLIVFNAVASSSDKLLQAGGPVLAALLFMALFHLLVLGLNYALSRWMGLDRPSTTAFTIHTSQKTLTVSYLVWAGYFASQYPMALIPAIGYHLTQTIVDTLVAQRFRAAAERPG